MNRSKIITNAFFLYLRMMVVMVIQIFTVRIVLRTLGNEDYGLFYTVAGVVSFLSFITSSMSSATSRFIAYEIGKKENSDVQSVFSSAWFIHLILAVVILVLAEIFGGWLLHHRLDIPEGRMWSAEILMQCSILMSLISILQVPFTASVIAHEKMNIFAAVEVVAVVLKLLILYAIPLLPYDRLIAYGGLLLFITLLVFLFYLFYCQVSIGNCRLKITYVKTHIQEMFSFSGWDLFGNLSVAARTQGVIIVIECFWGVLMVTAASLAMNVQNAIMSFAGNVLTAFRPQIVKSYAAKEYDEVDRLVCSAGAYTTLLLLLVTIPLLLEIDFVLKVWLGDPPSYTAEYCRLTLVFNLFANLSGVVISAIHANGNIKRPSFINGTLYLSVIPISIILFKNGVSPLYVYGYNIVAVCLGMLSNVWTLHLLMPSFRKRHFLFNVVFKTLLTGLIAFASLYYLSWSMADSWGKLILVTALSTITILLLAGTWILDKNEVSSICRKIKNFIR